MGGQTRKGKGRVANFARAIKREADGLWQRVKAQPIEIWFSLAAILALVLSGAVTSPDWFILGVSGLLPCTFAIWLVIGARNGVSERWLRLIFKALMATSWFFLVLLFLVLLWGTNQEADQVHIAAYVGWLFVALLFSRKGGWLLRLCVMDFVVPPDLHERFDVAKSLRNSQRIFRGLCYFFLGILYLSSRMSQWVAGGSPEVTMVAVQTMEAFLTFVIFDTGFDILFSAK